MTIKKNSVITCPDCGNRSTEAMPEKSCLFFWECPNCEKLMKPKEGDCCVFCSYGDTPCPPVQNSEKCC